MRNLPDVTKLKTEDPVLTLYRLTPEPHGTQSFPSKRHRSFSMIGHGSGTSPSSFLLQRGTPGPGPGQASI